MQVKFYKFIHICSATNIKSNNDHIANGIGFKSQLSHVRCYKL